MTISGAYKIDEKQDWKTQQNSIQSEKRETFTDYLTAVKNHHFLPKNQTILPIKYSNYWNTWNGG